MTAFKVGDRVAANGLAGIVEQVTVAYSVRLDSGVHWTGYKKDVEPAPERRSGKDRRSDLIDRRAWDPTLRHPRLANRRKS